MNLKLTSAIFLFSYLCAFYVHSADAQTWRSLNGPSATSSSLPDQAIIQGDTLFAVPGSGTIFKKSIHNTQWIPVSSSISETIKSFALDDQGKYYAVDFEVVFPTEPPFSIQNFFYSEDYGQSWKSVEDVVDMGINEIFINESGEVLLGGNGIYTLSEDKHSFNTVDSNFSVNTFYQHCDTLIAGGFNGIGISEDAGITWEYIGPDTLQVQSVTSSGDILFIVSNNSIIMKENLFDDGELISILPETTINVLHTAVNQVYVGTESGILSIDTESLTANPVFPGLSDKEIFSIDSISDILYTGTDAGFYTCSVEENSCNREDVPNSRVQSLNFQNNDTLFTGTSNNIHRYFTHTDQWDSLTVPVDRARSIIPIASDSLYTISGRFFYSCSFTNSSCDSTQVDPDNSLFNLTLNKLGNLFVVSTSGVFQSKDHGNTWDSIYTFATNKRSIRSPIFTISDSLLFINADEQGLVKYSLTTNNYSAVGFELTGINAHHLDSNDEIYVSAFYSIHKSTDYGESWETLLHSSDLFEGDILINVLYDEVTEKIYAVASRGRVYVSDDNGENWGINEEMYPKGIEDATTGPEGTLYLGTRGAGVFTNTQPLNPPISISNEDEPEVTVPDEFTLQQNYPNPFNPSTTITYSLPEPAEVRLTIYNLVGQEVAVLLNGMQNRGVHTVQFDATHLASGLYFYKLETKNYSETRKMMLVK